LLLYKWETDLRRRDLARFKNERAGVNRPSSRHAVIGVVRAKRTFTGVEDMPSYVGVAGHASAIVITEGEQD
jgi:hypothetical protein